MRAWVAMLVLLVGCGSEPAIESSLDPSLTYVALSLRQRSDLATSLELFHDKLFTRSDACRYVQGTARIGDWHGGALGDPEAIQACQHDIEFCTQVPLAVRVTTTPEGVDFERCGATVGEIIGCWESGLRDAAAWAQRFDCRNFVVDDLPMPSRECRILHDRCR